MCSAHTPVAHAKTVQVSHTQWSARMQQNTRLMHEGACRLPMSHVHNGLHSHIRIRSWISSLTETTRDVLSHLLEDRGCEVGSGRGKSLGRGRLRGQVWHRRRQGQEENASSHVYGGGKGGRRERHKAWWCACAYGHATSHAVVVVGSTPV